MFDISWGELLLIGVVALIVIGPKELPSVLRTVGQAMTKLRRMASEFQGQFQEAIREAEMSDLKKEVDDLATQAKSYTNFDPLADVQKEIEKTIVDKPAETSDKPAEVVAAAETASESPVETAVAASTLMAHTPADVAAPVESAMRAAAELNAQSAEADAALSAPQMPAVEVPPVDVPATDVSAPPAIARAPAPPAFPPAPPASPPAPPVSLPPPPAAAADDDWPEPASFREPLGPKRNAGSA